MSQLVIYVGYTVLYSKFSLSTDEITKLKLKARRQVLNYRLINSIARDKNYICVQRKGIIFLTR